MSARPFVRWWWNGNKVNAQEIVRELDQLKAAGIGGVEINPIAFPNPDDPLHVPALECFSGPWIRMYQVAVRAAKERGMAADSIVGSGWPFGGRLLAREEQTEILTVGMRRLHGPAAVTLSQDDLFAETELRLHSKFNSIDRRVYQLRLVPARFEEFQPGVDVSEHFRDGQLRFDAPEGEHVLYILVVQRGFQAVINGAPGADGPVLNHLDARAVRKYLDHFSDSLEPVLGRLGGSFRAMFCDSLEIEGANWCTDLRVSKRCRRGRSPKAANSVGAAADGRQAGPAIRPKINYFLRAIRRTLRVCEIAPGVRASLTISACSCWWRLPEPVAGLALSGRPT
jgi:hypothetical protein